jgi:hypothetical protein
MDAKKHITFGDLATAYCRQLTSCFGKAHTVADVFDRYDVKKTPSSRLKESVVLPGLKQLSQFPDFQMNRQCNTDFQGALMGYFVCI